MEKFQEEVINMETTQTRKIVLCALLSALTFVGTSIIRIPTPTTGYIHPGDSFVLLSGLLLGPLWGGLAAGVGSMLSDLLGGYLVYAPATFAIKTMVAVICAQIFQALIKRKVFSYDLPGLVPAGIVAEIFMVTGYFIFEIFLLAVLNQTDITSGLIAAAAGVVPNLIQGLFGVILSVVLYPILKKALERTLRPL